MIRPTAHLGSIEFQDEVDTSVFCSIRNLNCNGSGSLSYLGAHSELNIDAHALTECVVLHRTSVSRECGVRKMVARSKQMHLQMQQLQM